MAITFAFVNQKGGVLKTSSLFAISSILSVTKNPKTGKNFKVLVVDMDPQSTLTEITGLDPVSLELTLVNSLLELDDKKLLPIKDIIIPITHNFHIAPTNIDLSVIDTVLAQKKGRERVLSKALAPIKDEYDFIFIDCLPSLSLLTVNAMAAADYYIIPCSLQIVAFRGLVRLLETVDNIISSGINPDLKMYGVIATLNNRTTHSKEILELLQNKFKNKLIGIIPHSVFAQDAVYDGIDGYTRRKNRVTLAYKDIVNRIIKDLILEENNEWKKDKK